MPLKWVFCVHYVIVPISNGSFLHYKLSLTEQQENVAVVKPLSNNCITRYLSGSKCSYWLIYSFPIESLSNVNWHSTCIHFFTNGAFKVAWCCRFNFNRKMPNFCKLAKNVFATKTLTHAIFFFCSSTNWGWQNKKTTRSGFTFLLHLKLWDKEALFKFTR